MVMSSSGAFVETMRKPPPPLVTLSTRRLRSVTPEARISRPIGRFRTSNVAGPSMVRFAAVMTADDVNWIVPVDDAKTMRFAPAMALACCNAWRDETSSLRATTTSAPMHGHAMVMLIARARAASAADRAMAANLIAQRQRVVDGICGVVVVEVDVDRIHLALPCLDALGPCLELRIAVAPLILVLRRSV